MSKKTAVWRTAFLSLPFFTALTGSVFGGAFTANASALGAIPSSAWLVGPASPIDVGGGIPCIVTNQYGNGYSFRFSGGGGRLLAAAIDVGQPQFTRGRTYDVTLNIPGVFFQIIPANAHDEKTLLLGLQNIPDVYAALKGARTASLKIADNAPVDFMIAGLNDGFDRMERCFSGEGSGAGSNAAAGGQAQLPPGVFELKSGATRSLMAPASPDTGAALPGIAGSDTIPAAVVAPMPPIDIKTPPEPVSAGGANAANNATNIEALLNRAGDKGAKPRDEDAIALLEKLRRIANADNLATNRDAGVPVPTAAVKAPTPITPTNKADDAPRSVSTGHKLAGNWAEPTVRRADVGNIMHGQGANTADTPPPGHWVATKGQDLRSVLEKWGQQSGLRVIWMANETYTVQQSVSFQGPLDGALSRLLEQFAGRSERPVGRVYQDPVAGEPVLVVQSDRVWGG